MKPASVVLALVFGLLPGSLAHAEPRSVAPFHAIEIAGTIEVTASISPTTKVEVLGDADHLKQVKTDVKNGTLVIDTVGDVRHARLRVVVSAPSLDGLAITGTGTLTATGLAGNSLGIHIPGTGEITLSGKATKVALDIHGAGAVNAKELTTADANIDIQGTGEVSVHVDRSLVASISGTGAIKIHGKPTSIKRSITGVGVVKTAE